MPESIFRFGRQYCLSSFWLRKEEDVDDLKQRDGVHEKQNDKPSLLPVASGLPERHTLPRQGPQQNENDERHELLIDERIHNDIGYILSSEIVYPHKRKGKTALSTPTLPVFSG